MHGYRVQGTRVQGTGYTGIGYRVHGTRVQGTRVQGTRVQGTQVQGTRVQGTQVRGTRVQGTRVRGTRVQGTRVHGYLHLPVRIAISLFFLDAPRRSLTRSLAKRFAIILLILKPGMLLITLKNARVLDQISWTVRTETQVNVQRPPPPPPPAQGYQDNYQNAAGGVNPDKQVDLLAGGQQVDLMSNQPPPPYAEQPPQGFDQFPDGPIQTHVPTKIDY